MIGLTIFNKILSFVICIAPVLLATKIQILNPALTSAFIFCISCIFFAFIL